MKLRSNHYCKEIVQTNLAECKFNDSLEALIEKVRKEIKRVPQIIRLGDHSNPYAKLRIGKTEEGFLLRTWMRGAEIMLIGKYWCKIEGNPTLYKPYYELIDGIKNM